MYVESQGPFLNAVVEVRTGLEPLELLRELKHTEQALGRTTGGLRNGPRIIDLDVLLYGQRQLVDNAHPYAIQVPHPRISQRPFVLTPLADIDPHLHIPGLGPISSSSNGDSLMRVTPLADGSLFTWDGGAPLMMGIVNVTPDSFSDGGQFVSIDSALHKVEQFKNSGFQIVDIGGCSTRPGARLVPEDVEMQRVLPVIRAIKDEYPDIAISVDTFRGGVAREAVQQGAVIINDVGAGTWCSHMIPAVRDTSACWIAMHSRGRPDSMMKNAVYDNVVEDTARELGDRVNTAISQGVYRWNVMIDGGVGFAKTAKHNAQLIRGWNKLKTRCGDYPTLLGLSRKNFLNAAVMGGSGSAEERDWATAGALVAAISAGGVDMVRVHNSLLGDAIRGSALIHEHVLE